MRRTLLLLIGLCYLFSTADVEAQVVQTNSKWWDGSVLYNAKLRMGNTVFFEGVDASGNTYEFTIEREGDTPGMYKLTPSRQADNAPWGAEFGWRVQYIRQDGMYFLAVRNPKGDAMQVMVLTPDNLQNCISQEEYAEAQPVSENLCSMLLNNTYLSRFSRDELRLMRNEILARHGYKFQSKDLQEYFGGKSWYKPAANNNSIKLSIIEQTNVQLIKSMEARPRPEDFPGGLADDGRDPAEIAAEGVRTVYSEKEFLGALRNNSTVQLGENVHLNLSRVLEEESLFSGVKGRRWISIASDLAGSGSPIVCSESETDGRQLSLVNFQNLTIRGLKNSSIEVNPRYSFCINFINCEGCKVENLTIGHSEGGYCSGGVIGYTGGRMNAIVDCDLYGCGTYGIDANRINNLLVTKTNIHDCTYGILQLRASYGVRFNSCDFFNNREYTLIESYGCEDVEFSDCRIFANWGDAPLFGSDSPFRLSGCEIYHPKQNLGTIQRAIQEGGSPNKFVDNPLDTSIKPRSIGPDQQ